MEEEGEGTEREGKYSSPGQEWYTLWTGTRLTAQLPLLGLESKPLPSLHPHPHSPTTHMYTHQNVYSSLPKRFAFLLKLQEALSFAQPHICLECTHLCVPPKERFPSSFKRGFRVTASGCLPWTSPPVVRGALPLHPGGLVYDIILCI